MNRQILAALVAMTACSNDTDGGDIGWQPGGGGELTAASNLTPGHCPVDASQVAAAVGRELPADPDSIGASCHFGDGTAEVRILVTKSTVDPADNRARDLAARSGYQVTDLERGDAGYLATRDTDALAATTFGDANLSVNTSGVPLYRAGFEKLAHSLIDAATG